ncbi:MAG TPA: hypothetical protein VFI25_18045 [Planctomycetota bacterium]|jgi:hypothetical protein|nr:hypothetical protein [Planctomycetota bacterium]
MQREIDVLRNRLRALAVPPGPAAPPAVRQPSRTAAAPTPEPAEHPGALPDQRVALLLDFPGLLAFARKRGRSVSAEEILRGVVRGRRLVRAVAYGAPGTGEELASLLEHAGFEILAGEGSRSAAAADLRTLSARVDSVVAAGFDDSLEGPLREARESGARTEVAGFEPNDAPGLAGVAHAFLRLGEEGPPRPRG